MKNISVRFAFLVIGLTLGLTFLFRMSNNMLQTTAPVLAHDTLHLSNQEVGILAAIFGVTVVLATFTINSWVKLHQIEWAIGIGFLLLAMTLPLYGFVHSLWGLIIIFGISGFASGIVQPFLPTLVTKYSVATKRDRYLALYTLALSFSLTVGPLLEVLILRLDQGNLRNTFTLFTIIPILGILLSGCIILLGHQGLNKGEPAFRAIKGRTPILMRLSRLAKNRTYMLGFISNLTYMIPFIVIVVFSGIYAHTRLSASYGTIQLVFAIFFTASFMARSAIAFFSPITHKNRMLWFSIVLTICGLLLLSISHTLLLFVLALALLGIPHGITYPISTMLIAEGVSRDDLSFANSLFTSSVGVAGVVIPIIVGLLTPAIGFRPVFLLVTGSVCLLAILQYLVFNPYRSHVSNLAGENVEVDMLQYHSQVTEAKRVMERTPAVDKREERE